MEGKNRRRVINYSIKRAMQLRLLRNMVMVSVISVGISSVFFYFYSNQEVGESYRQFHVNIRNFLDMLLPVVITASLSGLVLAVIVSLFYPHRIAGALHRMEKELRDKVGEGDFRIRFTVRKSDEVKELADTLNIMVEKLRLRAGRLKAATEELSNEAQRNGPRFNDALRNVEEAVKEFKV